MRFFSARSSLGALAMFACASVHVSRASANPLDTFGFGSRGTAMGGAQAADVRDASAGYYNPAGLVLARGLEISVGYVRASHALSLNGKDTRVDPVSGLNAGVVAPGKIFGVPFAFGLALHLPDDRISRVRALRQEQPRWELYDNRNQRLFLAANVAFSPWEWLQIGGGLSFMSSTQGRLDITGSANVFSPEQSQLRHEVDADLTAIRYPQLGARIALGKRAALGLVYRGEFQLDLTLAARLRGDISGLTSALYELETKSVNAFLPEQVVFGGSWLLADALRANVDVTWVHWSAYVAPVAKLDVALDIPPPAGGWPGNITPPTTPAPTKIVPIAMKDRLVPHVGVEWRAVTSRKVDLLARAGYEFAKSPIPPQRGVTNYVDGDRHAVSLGAGLVWKEPAREIPGDLRLDAHVHYAAIVERVTRKDSPADTVGDYVSSGHIVNLGATLSLAFR